MKRNVNISVDEYIHDQAKQKGINISETAERAIVQKLHPENPIDEIGEKCEYCGIKMPHATVRKQNGLMWCLPDEKWICPRCLHGFVEKLIKEKTG